ncbi:Exo-beta-D-glucosaminidase [termite gut metagenome]|uniref:Exo-beta-D-glucosaminidase n=1 Tax=termite gut metagenome TaxID=433724 RepID=A0A5J4REI6_9ZZZZ
MKVKQYLFLTASIIYLSILFVGCSSNSGQYDYYTRGIGAYPGSPDENFSPQLVVDKSYRNIAKYRSAYHSSSYDYNLTSQLITDGLISSELPATINVSTQAGDLLKNEREWLFDGKPDSRYRIAGDNIYLQLSLNNSSLSADKINVRGTVVFDADGRGGYETLLSGSNDGINWEVIGKEKGSGYVGTESAMRFEQPASSTQKRVTRIINQTFTLDKPVDYKHYKVAYKLPFSADYAFSDWDFFQGNELLVILPSQYFTSAWMSAGTGEEWVYVDFGASASFDKINLQWINKATKGSIQSSSDGETWSDIALLPGGTDKTDVINLGKSVNGRYVRVLVKEPENNQPYILSELEVYGKGGLVPHAHAAPKAKDNQFYLSGGNWKLQRASEVNASGENISQSGFNAEDWIIATVPGTVLTSYWNIGALPNPNYSDNQLQISESFFNSNFWYRNNFTIPAGFSDGRLFLNLDGINWKANVFVNGKKVGRIEGGFLRGKFDVTDLVIPDKTNSIAIEIIKNIHVGAVKEQTVMSTDQNGGILGADNPTFHSTVGWDWIPTIRGRDIGIWNDVFLTHTGAVTIEDPFVRAELSLPDTTSASIFFEVTLKNNISEAVSGKLTGKYGDVGFETEVSLGASEVKVINLDPSTFPVLKLQNPKLWWPKGYGAPNLYDVELSFVANGVVSDQKKFQSGVRQMAFSEDNATLNLYINGRRFIGRGGNWGFPESNLNYRGREYDISVAYHADMNFTMIRNWVGQTGDEEFYEACDRHGIMVWQDFWLANPYDGPDPYYSDIFLVNAEDYVKRIRNHPSIGLYCGRNEGFPPIVIDTALRTFLPVLHPGIHYIPSSADVVVSGHGPYRALPPKQYFSLNGNTKFHSERGMPNVMTYESMLLAFGKDALWPQNSQYGLHDFTLGSAQSGATFNKLIEDGFGAPQSAQQFAELGQWINYNGYRAMFEGRSDNRQGLLLWMSHSAWPSMTWQTYDYYFDPAGAYFGCKKGNEPLHIQWNQAHDFIEVVNYHAFDRSNLTAKAQLINLDGSVQWEKETTLTIKEDETVKCFDLIFPETLSDTHFVKLILTENGTVVSDNFYWRGKEDGNYKALNQLPKVTLANTTSVSKQGGEWLLTTTLKNATSTPALMIRLNVTGSDGQRILPVFFSDNYFFLLPNEEKTVTMKLFDVDTRGEKPKVEVSGFNL